jgi:hypothetical protein
MIDQIWVRLRAGKAAKPTVRELGLSTGTVRAYLVRCGGIRPEPRHRAPGRCRRSSNSGYSNSGNEPSCSGSGQNRLHQTARYMAAYSPNDSRCECVPDVSPALSTTNSPRNPAGRLAWVISIEPESPLIVSLTVPSSCFPSSVSGGQQRYGHVVGVDLVARHEQQVRAGGCVCRIFFDELVDEPQRVRSALARAATGIMDEA